MHLIIYQTPVFASRTDNLIIMKCKNLSFLLLVIVSLLSSYSSEAKSRRPKSKTKIENSSAKPKVEKQDYCIIRGYYEEITEGETKFFICRLVSAGKCVAVPCNVWGPYGPNHAKAVESGPVPERLQIDTSRKYIVKFNVNGATEVQYVNEISIEEKEDFIAIHYY